MFQNDGVSCRYIGEECTTLTCNEHGVCVVKDGVEQCDCHTGYTVGQSGDCVDVDECTEGGHQCQGNAQCQNTLGGYNCACTTGYRLAADQRTCQGKELS